MTTRITHSFPSRMRAAYSALSGGSVNEVALTMAGRKGVGEYALDASTIGSHENLAAARARSAIGGKLAPWQSTMPAYPAENTRQFITRGYRNNPAMRACVDMLSRTFTQGRLCVVDRETGEEITDHPMTKVIGNPTNVRGPHDRWTRTVQDLYLSGSAMWEKVRAKGSDDVVEIWRLDPLRIRIELADQEWIARYWYDVGGTWYPIETRNIIHWMFPDPLDPGWFGIPPIISAAKTLSIDNELIDQMKVTLQNRAVPSVVLEAGDHLAVNEDTADEARRMWKKRYGGSRQGDVAVTSMKVKVIGMNWNEMALGEVISVPESRIAMVHGIPMILLGRSGTQADPTRANFREAKLHFWFDTMNPLHTSIAQLLELYLLPEFPGWQRYAVKFDTSGVPILQEARLDSAIKARSLFKDGMISRHVAQDMGGIQNHGPDVFYRSSSVDAVFPANATEEDVTEEL